jgi:hypothetical protein
LQAIKPSLVVVTDLDETRFSRAKKIFTPEDAMKDGVKLVFTIDSVFGLTFLINSLYGEYTLTGICEAILTKI